MAKLQKLQDETRKKKSITGKEVKELRNSKNDIYDNDNRDKVDCHTSGSESESPKIDLNCVFVFQEVVWRLHELQQEG